MKRILVFGVLLLAACGFLRAQQSFVFSGTVTDSLGRPLPYVQVRIEKSTQGTLSDTRGHFVLMHTRSEATLRFSLLGHEPVSLTLQTDGPSVNVILRQKAGELDAVSIHAQKLPKLAPSVCDYDFLDEYILLLQYKNGSARSRLLVLDNRDMEVRDSLDVPPKARGLYRDCLGNVHLLRQDSVSPVRYERGKLHLGQGVSVSAFETYPEPCVAAAIDRMYLQKKEAPYILETKNFKIHGANLSVRYYQMDRLTRQPEMLLSIIDSTGLRERKDMAGYAERIRLTHGAISNVPPGVLMDDFDLFFTETVFLKDVYAPLFVIADTAYVFDMLHAQLSAYGRQKERLFSLPLNFQKDRRWIRNILKDPKTERVYTLFDTPEGFELREIDLRSGNATNRYAIPLPYIDNIRVEAGYVYFLYRRTQNSVVYYLSRMRLG